MIVTVLLANAAVELAVALGRATRPASRERHSRDSTAPSEVSSIAISYTNDGSEKTTIVGSASVGASSNHQDFGIARLLSDGNFDTSLASSGHLTINVGACCNVTFDQSAQVSATFW